MNNDTSDTRFDASMRQRHAVAVARPSARTRAQLQQRLRAAMAGQPAPATGLQRRGWPLAAAFAAVLAVVVSLQLRPQSTPQPVAPTVDSAIVADDAALDTMFDENPDFYLWLASTDADTLALE